MIQRIAGVVVRPRPTLTELAARPVWASTWLVILALWAVCGAWLLSTETGVQALVDERVRVIEAFGGSVTDEAYAALQSRPPWWVYTTSGGRLLLNPVTTLAVATALWAVARIERRGASLCQTLAIVVHASVVPLVEQLVVTPLHFVRESLMSPFNLAAVLPLMEEGTFQARLFGSLDLFALWWLWLVALGASILTGRKTGRYFWPALALLVAAAGGMAGVMAALGGT